MSRTPGSPASEWIASCSTRSSTRTRANVPSSSRMSSVACRCGDRHRMPGVGVAVEELDQVLRAGHESVVDLLADDHAAERDRGVVHPLGEDDHVGHHAEALGGERRAHAAEAGDHLVEDQEDPVLRAQFAQPLEIADRRHDHARRTLHRLDDHGRDRRRVVQRDDPRQLVGEMRAPLRLAARERHLGEDRAYAADGRRRAVARTERSCGWRPSRRRRSRRSRRRDSRARGR